MAASALVITGANGDTPTTEGIFSGLSFFLVQRLPSRTTFVNKIQTNGGRVVKLEAQADHVIADQYRKDSPPGSISYEFIDQALKNGVLPEPSDHPAGLPKGSVRPLAAGLPTKGTRTPFTAEDDRELYTWVKRCEARGGSVKGNELYKQLEVRNPRHTFQAWRDRYIKKLMNNPPAGFDVDTAVNGEDEEKPEAAGWSRSRTQRGAVQQPDPPAPRLERKIMIAGEEFDDENSEMLISMGGDIVNLASDRKEEAWEAFAKGWPQHSASSWRRLWDEFSKPEYLRRQAHEKSTEIEAEGSDSQLKVIQYKPPNAAPRQSVDSLKRKRATPSPGKPATCGRKKVKDDHDHFGVDASDEEHGSTGRGSITHPNAQVSDIPAPPQGPQQDDHQPLANAELKMKKSNGDRGRDSSSLLTSDANKAAAKQLDDDYARLWAESSQAKGQEDDATEHNAPIATKEANKATETQLYNDYDRFSSESKPVAEQHGDESLDRDALKPQLDDKQGQNGDKDESGLPTSEINLRADRQLRNESLERNGATESDISQSSRQEQVQPSNDQQARERASKGDISVYANGDSLTQENLATQDEQHRGPQLRGADLPEDEETHDQTDFVNDLQSLQSGHQPSNQNGMINGAQNPILSTALRDPSMTSGLNDVSVQMEIETSDRRESPRLRSFELPLSSPRELDQIMDDTLHWPQSPQAGDADKYPQSQVQDQSLQFDTQVQYPFMPPQGQDSALFSLEEPKEVRYPELASPSQQKKASTFEDLQTRFDREVLGVGQSDRQDDEADEDGPFYRDVGDEIQLEVPEPESGFGFSSQPWHSQQDNLEPARPQQGPIQEEYDFNKPESDLEFASSPPRDARQTLGAGRAVRQSLEAARANEEDVRASTERPIDITSTSSSSSSEVNPDLEQEDEDLPLDTPQALETQDIYDANTQAPDLRMPSPDAFSDRSSLAPSSSSPSNRKTAAPGSQTGPALTETQTLSDDDDVDAYVNRMTVVYKHSENAVIGALKCTSMRPELAELVLLEGKAGKGLPADVPGVWSEEEDMVLEGGNAKALRALEEKHGWRECEARLEWLGQWREDEEGEDEE